MRLAAEKLEGPAPWFKPVAIGFAAVVVAVIIIAALPRPTPESAARKYVSALARGKCKKAYRLVSRVARLNFPEV